MRDYHPGYVPYHAGAVYGCDDGAARNGSVDVLGYDEWLEQDVYLLEGAAFVGRRSVMVYCR